MLSEIPILKDSANSVFAVFAEPIMTKPNED